MPDPKPSERRFFLCTGQCVAYKDLYKYPESHILGELRYVTDEQRKVTALALYLTPIYAGTVPPVNPVIVAYIIGDARLIKCRYADCDKVQRWEIGKAGFLSLMDRMGLQHKVLELEKAENEVKPMGKIFLWCVPNGGGTGIVNGSVPGGDVAGYALAEDGTALAWHISSSENFSQYDMGFTSKRNHDAYQKHYPNGFELEWVSDPDSHELFKVAYEKMTEKRVQQ